MIYYKYEFICDSEPLAGNSFERYEAYTGLTGKREAINEAIAHHARQRAEFFISEINGQNVVIAGIAERMESGKLARLAGDFFTRLGLAGKPGDSRELTNRQFMELLKSANGDCFIESAAEIARQWGLADVFSGQDYEQTESLIDRVFTKKQALAQCQRLLCGASMRAELERIFAARSPRNFSAHPVHYVIDYGDEQERDGMARELLLGSLFQAGRLHSRRVCQIQPHKFDLADLSDVYRAQQGGVVVLDFCGRRAGDDIERIAGLIRKRRRDVLTIMEFWRRDELREAYMQELDGVSIVRLDYDTMASPEAVAYLQGRAKADGVKDRASLLGSLPAGRSEYYVSELERLYEDWYGEYLRGRVFPQYRNISITPRVTDIAPQEDAYEQLSAMVGLTEAKAVIRRMIDFQQAQELLERRGIKTPRPAMHMAFTGNPGTAKTTVARLVARIMQEHGLLSVGGLVEAGRADLVDRYVGGTAPRVRSLFKRARGSVLFIDEAYSLADGRRGLYGDEAISAIVQEMENMREDMAVIFAGYPDRMEEFLRANPGLRSRIAFHVPFADYSAEELAAILERMAAAEGLTLDGQARRKARQIIEAAMGQEDFGNGRFCRNLFEQAKMRQASRLVARAGAETSDEYLRALLASDFELPAALAAKKEARQIGFMAS